MQKVPPLLRIWLVLLAVLAALGLAAWATDFITPEGERTIYAVKCEQGQWQGRQCSGKLVPGDRYRFRALKQHEEVLFWTVGASGASSKFSNCKIRDGRNWSCPPGSVSRETVTRELQRGNPVVDTTVPLLDYHGVTKWRWILLSYGIPTGSSVD